MAVAGAAVCTVVGEREHSREGANLPTVAVYVYGAVCQMAARSRQALTLAGLSASDSTSRLDQVLVHHYHMLASHWMI